jgi:hypothetical protein
MLINQKAIEASGAKKNGGNFDSVPKSNDFCIF